LMTFPMHAASIGNVINLAKKQGLNGR